MQVLYLWSSQSKRAEQRIYGEELFREPQTLSFIWRSGPLCWRRRKIFILFWFLFFQKCTIYHPRDKRELPVIIFIFFAKKRDLEMRFGNRKSGSHRKCFQQNEKGARIDKPNSKEPRKFCAKKISGKSEFDNRTNRAYR